MASYQTVPYTHFRELVDTCTNNAQAIKTQVKSLSEKARVLGTSADTQEIRTRLDEDEKRLHQLATATKTALKQLVDEMNRRKKELSKDDLNLIKKVETDMKNALTSYEDAVTNVSKRRQQFQNLNRDTLIDIGDENLTADDIHQHLELQQQMKMNNNILMQQNDEQFIIEEQIYQVQNDVIEINHIMRDIGAIVSEQSPIIAGIEQSVIATNDNIVAGNQQLQGASRYQKKYRKKLCWLLIILLIIGIIVGVIIALKLR